MSTSFPYEPPIAPYLLPPGKFDLLIGRMGQRISWMRSHSCPCVFAGGGANGALPFPGSAQRSCQQCFGTGTYWDAPTLPAMLGINFMQLSPTPDEPGARMDAKFGAHQMAEPSLTIPYTNPFLAVNDPAQPTQIWTNASLNDIFIPVDMLARFTAVLQVGGQEFLPYQQNLQIAPSGAVTTWDTATSQIAFVPYTVSGAQVTVPSLPEGTNYMVEFQAAPLYVAFRPAGGMPHSRQYGGGIVNEPKRFKVQALDFWTRQSGRQQAIAAGTTKTGGISFPFAIMTGRVTGGG